MEKKRKKMMYGRTPMEGGGMYGMKKKKRKGMSHGGPHNNMDRIGMGMGGAMEVQDPN
jgi:hypothetical protein